MLRQTTFILWVLYCRISSTPLCPPPGPRRSWGGWWSDVCLRRWRSALSGVCVVIQSTTENGVSRWKKRDLYLCVVWVSWVSVGCWLCLWYCRGSAACNNAAAAITITRHALNYGDIVVHKQLLSADRCGSEAPFNWELHVNHIATPPNFQYSGQGCFRPAWTASRERPLRSSSCPSCPCSSSAVELPQLFPLWLILRTFIAAFTNIFQHNLWLLYTLLTVMCYSFLWFRVLLW